MKSLHPADFESVLNALESQIALIDSSGVIEWVNQSWIDFGRANGGPLGFEWRGQNYLSACLARPEAKHDVVTRALERIFVGSDEQFEYEYPCHSPSKDRWFRMRVTALSSERGRGFVVQHDDITERRLAEQAANNRALTDPLTGIANRRRFEEFLDVEWRRAARYRRPLTVGLIDLDAFKSFNDSHGHLAGDAALRVVATALNTQVGDAGALVARFGGEEFVVVLPETDGSAAAEVFEGLREHIANLPASEDLASPITVSAGYVVVDASASNDISGALRSADSSLYQAKSDGRNRVHGTCFGAPVQSGAELQGAKRE